MTIQEYLAKMLFRRGLWPNEAAEVLDAMVADGSMKSMSRRWDEDTAGYPLPLLAVLSSAAKRHAAEWLASHKPQHWARPMFEEEGAADPT